jgi:hypothetical protein
MRFSSPRRAFVPAILTGIAIAAGCSSSSPPPKVYVYGTLIPTTGGSCAGFAGSMTAFMSIGSAGPPGANEPARVSDGGPVHVSCDVKGGGSNFQISLSVTSDSSVVGTGGSMRLDGSNISTSGGTNLDGAFTGLNTSGTYTATDCTLTFPSTSAGSAGGIAPGRIWGHIDCVGATNGAATVGTNGMSSTCTVGVDFIFENCGS